jgi:DNA adenine methylase
MAKPRLKTPISYYGGKQTMLPHILPLIPKHTVFTEAFCGGCAVLFAKEPAPCEIINDTNKELINFYRVAQIDYEALKREIDASLHSRDLHTHARHIMTHPQFFTPVQRAWAVWIGSKLGFASMLDGTFGYDRSGTTNLKLFNAKDNFTEMLCQRLSHVIIESEDGKNVIQRYDTAEAFHFVDPPYVNSDCGHYTGSFSEENFAELLDILTRVKGKFMLTMFPHDLLREYISRHGWHTHKIERSITASKDSRRRQEEWMVTNY